MKRYRVRITLKEITTGDVWRSWDVIKYDRAECDDAVYEIIKKILVYIYNNGLRLEVEELY